MTGRHRSQLSPDQRHAVSMARELADADARGGAAAIATMDGIQGLDLNLDGTYPYAYGRATAALRALLAVVDDLAGTP
jgi:hypothetical protein